jgi:arabinan endo-1,5-alpha-L-arabinosidase
MRGTGWCAGMRCVVPLLAGWLLVAQGMSQVTPAAGAGRPVTAAVPTPGQGGRGFGPAVGVPVVGMPFVHDPSTVVRFHGKYYVYTTGRGASFISSPDGVTWTREGSAFAKIPDEVHAAVPKNDGAGVWAPDIVRVGGLFYLYYAVSSWGSFNSAVALMTNPVLDPKDPAYQWTDRGVVVSSDGVENLNAIDPGVLLAPDGRLWLSYGSYHGTIDVVELDRKTGLRIAPNSPVSIVASGSEASDVIFHDGYYYLFVNHGSCCKGKDSEYNIRVGRSRAVIGPYADKQGTALATGGGSLFLAAHDHRIGPGHFGRVLDYDDPADGAERFSVHYEADLTRGGRSVLDIRPLLWSVDGWPVAGDNLTEGTYQIVARRSENSLEDHVPAAAKPVAAGDPAFPPGPVEAPGPATLRMTRYLAIDSEKWTIAPVAGGFYKIVNVGTGDAIGMTGSAVGLAAYTGMDGQIWTFEEFPDGGWRIRNKGTGMSLTESGSGMVTAGEFVRDEEHLWSVTTP